YGNWSRSAPSTAGAARHRPGRVLRRAARTRRRARPRTALLAGALPLGARRDGRHRRPRQDVARRPDLGPDHAALRGRLAARRGDAGGAVGAVRVRRLPAAAPPRTRRDAEVVPPMTMPAFRPTHVVPRHGMPAWEEPDPS